MKAQRSNGRETLHSNNILKIHPLFNRLPKMLHWLHKKNFAWQINYYLDATATQHKVAFLEELGPSAEARAPNDSSNSTKIIASKVNEKSFLCVCASFIVSYTFTCYSRSTSIIYEHTPYHGIALIIKFTY